MRVKRCLTPVCPHFYHLKSPCFDWRIYILSTKPSSVPRWSTTSFIISNNMIRLLNAETRKLQDDNEMRAQQGQPYVIISHVWLDREIVFDDMPCFGENVTSSKPLSAAKMLGACQFVLRHYNGNVKYLWLDTVCIDKKNLTELSMAINSMYRWYRQAKV